MMRNTKGYEPTDLKSHIQEIWWAVLVVKDQVLALISYLVIKIKNI